MEIQFTNIGNLWVAEFEVTADFNLHLERENVGTLHFYQRTTPHGEYDYINNQGYNADDKVIDIDFQALVYPKWIKIKSAVKPLIATITTDGEVNEVVYQAKEIEITSNGTTEVTADTGYTALASVNVKVNVPSEGGGSSVSEDDILYYYLGSGTDSTFVINLSTKEVLYKHRSTDEVLFENDTVVFKVWNIINEIVGMSMLSTLPFIVERLDDNITANITSVTSKINYSYFGVIRNSLGAERHDTGSYPDRDGVLLLRDGGLFKLTTGHGKEYLINIQSND